ncbi:cap1-related protein [Phaffia rhodozyma]|uniref:Cap1-related protein n=1 Tax=Phaffia rhodozyma TaxID=264483 RepID=A0A0F7SNA2_PHARH|nr:cap1-related protein [Phaffia rhodozyma]
MAPRKMLLLVLLSSGMTSLLLFSFFQPPPLPLPEFMSMNASPWLEFGPDEQCLFVSPLSELTSAERQAAESLLPSIDSAFESPNGLLSFRPTAGNASVVGEPSADKTVHPVLGLLAQGERRWKNMIDKQSRTLGEAVEEYKKRMGRQPPKGFDHWWAFATANQVLFPDEYDPIMNSLLPFYALPPDEIAQRVTEAESIPETFTLIVKEGGKVVLQWNDQYSRDIWWNARTRADHQINLMEPFLDKLGEMRVTFSIHDQPFMVLPYERRQELEGLAKGRVGSYTSHLIDEDIHTADWINACPPDSPARTGTEALFIGEENGKEKDSVRFVVNHESAMNPCSNPSLLQSHIHFLTPQTESTKPKPHSRLLPILSLSRTEVNADIPVAPVGIVSGGLTRQDVGKEMDGGWPAQSPKLYWRGAPTANPKVPISPSIFANSHRTRLASLAQGNSSRSEEEHMLMVPSGARDGSVEVQSIKGDILAQKFLDVQLQGSWTCEDENDEQCNKLK